MPNRLETLLVDTFRNKLLRRFLDSRRGRKILSKALPDDITALTVRAGDHMIMVDPRDLVGRSVVLHGSWGRGAVDRIVAYLERVGKIDGTGVALNLGANVGCQALYLKLTGRFTKVIAVEAAPRNFELLRANVHLNGWADAISPVHAAVYTEDGRITLHLKQEGVSGGHSLLALPGNTEAVEVDAFTVASIARNAGVSGEDIQLVWMDLEGFDFEILRTIHAIFGGGLPVLFEFSPRFVGEAAARDVIAFLRANYENICDFNGAGGEPTEVEDFERLAKTPQKDLLVYNS